MRILSVEGLMILKWILNKLEMGLSQDIPGSGRDLVTDSCENRYDSQFA